MLLPLYFERIAFGINYLIHSSDFNFFDNNNQINLLVPINRVSD